MGDYSRWIEGAAMDCSSPWLDEELDMLRDAVKRGVDSRVQRSHGGASEVMREIIARTR
jgi:alkylation response protein AidB-like acyl-CoA dehydrogenase